MIEKVYGECIKSYWHQRAGIYLTDMADHLKSKAIRLSYRMELDDVMSGGCDSCDQANLYS